MNVQLQTIPQLQTEPIQPQFNIPRWNLALRIAFRFWMVYLGLYCLATQIIITLFSIPGSEAASPPDPAALWPLRPAISWIGAHIFHVNAPLTVFWGVNSSSADCIFAWVMAFCVLVVSTAATVVWALLDRRRENYAELHKWFRLLIRFALAGQMILYGMGKVIPIQMEYPSLIRLLQPVGTLSPMGLLWVDMGFAPAYQIFCGCTELVGGLLLIVPRTATLGALVSLAAMIQVFMLNMTHDVPVKLLVFHLILLCCFLLAPDVPRLVRFLLLRQTTSLSTQVQLFRSVRANRITLAVQIIFGLWLVGAACYFAWGAWKIVGLSKPLPPLYGIWDVKQMSIDEQPRPPLLTDSTRWRRAIFDFPEGMAFQRMDDSFAKYVASVNLPERTLALTKRGDKNWKANFTFQQPAGDQLILDGQMDNHQVHMELQLMDRNSFRLVSRGFHWAQTSPFGRYYRDPEGK
ncbi:MAG: DoxX family protein [Candidatus Angelobacter sp. Gp1-AA117]|nr:MAG: DoxX family protein [Candidatus Angelobacter sp. Gp1-AA117]